MSRRFIERFLICIILGAIVGVAAWGLGLMSYHFNDDVKHPDFMYDNIDKHNLPLPPRPLSLGLQVGLWVIPGLMLGLLWAVDDSCGHRVPWKRRVANRRFVLAVIGAVIGFNLWMGGGLSSGGGGGGGLRNFVTGPPDYPDEYYERPDFDENPELYWEAERIKYASRQPSLWYRVGMGAILGLVIGGAFADRM